MYVLYGRLKVFIHVQWRIRIRLRSGTALARRHRLPSFATCHRHAPPCSKRGSFIKFESMQTRGSEGECGEGAGQSAERASPPPAIALLFLVLFSILLLSAKPVPARHAAGAGAVGQFACSARWVAGGCGRMGRGWRADGEWGGC